MIFDGEYFVVTEADTFVSGIEDICEEGGF